MKNIQPLCKGDYSKLHNFEIRNWDYFTQFIPARPESYRAYESFCHAQNILLIKQQANKTAFFILYDESEPNRIISRVNLSNITNESASIGYRVCQSVAGQGVASECVRQIIEQAKQLNINKLTAIVSNDNPASERILVKNGFVFSHTEENAFELNGQMLDFKHFQKTIVLG